MDQEKPAEAVFFDCAHIVQSRFKRLITMEV
jgi:hypothetical protein